MLKKKEQPKRRAIRLQVDFKVVNADGSIASTTYKSGKDVKDAVWVTLRNEDRYPDHVEFVLVYE